MSVNRCLASLCHHGKLAAPEPLSYLPLSCFFQEIQSGHDLLPASDGQSIMVLVRLVLLVHSRQPQYRVILHKTVSVECYQSTVCQRPLERFFCRKDCCYQR